MQQPTVSLTPSQVDFFWREGYLRLEQLSTPAEIAGVVAVYDQLFTEMAGWDEGNAFDLAGTDEEGRPVLPQILGPSRYAPELRETLYYANAWQVAQELLGPEARQGGDHAILKPAGYGAETPWHQDEAYWDPTVDYQSLSVWVPLQDATIANGCLYFVPGTHRLEVLPHHCVGHDPRVHALELDHLDSPDLQELIGRAVACPLPAGGATFHLSRTFHYAPANATDQPRRAHILGFSTPPKPRTVARDFYWNTQKRTAREERRRAWQAQQAEAATAAKG